MARSTTVTRAAMIRMKTGMRTSKGMNARRAEMAKLAMIMTNVVASPRLNELMKVVVMASVGQRASTWPRMGFCFQKLARAMSL